ncbi:MAG: hypothetical protein OdinLCB4_000070 [Candidatus Odinarchaeum yellowstonii]|uniref:Uncharacterized protein n=1 Tax=Odinarchaeota yellowstonii (strain LCB_4) TaxID=1841599 RepID=A0AAF0D2B8_ODILC|nr:MAG: hypothetical protein OdinLCB4_000070 [Candidatus Odinarchaeum yellowstonii]
MTEMSSDEKIRKLILQLSGIFYEIKEDYLKKLYSVFKSEEEVFNSRLELKSLMDSSKKISENILEEFSSVLLKECIKIVTRYIEALNNSLEVTLNDFKNRFEEEKNGLKRMLADKNMLIKKILVKEPKFKLLSLVEEYGESDLKTLKLKTRIQSEKLTNLLKNLRRDRYIQLFKSGDALKVVFKNAPWL